MSKKVNESLKKGSEKVLDEKKVEEMKALLRENLELDKKADEALDEYKKAIFAGKNVAETDALLYAYDKAFHDCAVMIKKIYEIAKDDKELLATSIMGVAGDFIGEALNEGLKETIRGALGDSKPVKAKKAKKEAK